MTGEIRMKKIKIKKIKIRIFIILLGVFAFLTALIGIICYIKQQDKEALIQNRGSVRIVVLADSIWDIARDETGIAFLLEEELENAVVYNCGIMGTTAALKPLKDEDIAEGEVWNALSLTGLLRDQEAIVSLVQEEQLTEVPIKEADYFIIAYGLNDYFSAVPRETEEKYDLYSYAGALRNAIEFLQNENKEATILLLSQTYSQGYSYGKVDTESDWKDWGGGTGPDYVYTAEKVANEYGCIFVNNYEDLGINLHNGLKYLSDAVHLTPYGREKYAENLAKYLLQDYEEQNRNEFLND